MSYLKCPIIKSRKSKSPTKIVTLSTLIFSEMTGLHSNTSLRWIKISLWTSRGSYSVQASSQRKREREILQTSCRRLTLWNRAQPHKTTKHYFSSISNRSSNTTISHRWGGDAVPEEALANNSSINRCSMEISMAWKEGSVGGPPTLNLWLKGWVIRHKYRQRSKSPWVSNLFPARVKAYRSRGLECLKGLTQYPQMMPMKKMMIPCYLKRRFSSTLTLTFQTDHFM